MRSNLAILLIASDVCYGVKACSVTVGMIDRIGVAVSSYNVRGGREVRNVPRVTTISAVSHHALFRSFIVGSFLICLAFMPLSVADVSADQSATPFSQWDEKISAVNSSA